MNKITKTVTVAAGLAFVATLSVGCSSVSAEKSGKYVMVQDELRVGANQYASAPAPTSSTMARMSLTGGDTLGSLAFGPSTLDLDSGFATVPVELD